MPILSAIGRQSPKMRLLIALIYAALGLGALAMLYPLGLMAAGSTKSIADLRENVLVPRFLVSDEALWQKHLEALFNESMDALNIAFDTDYIRFSDIPLPPPDASGADLVPLWRDFLAGGHLPPEAIAIGHYWAPQAGAFPVQLRRFRRHLQDTYGSLDALNAAMGTDFDAWYTVFVQPPAYLFPYARPDATPLAAEFDAFKLTAPPWCRVVLSPEGFFRKLYLKPRHSRDIAAYNAAHGTAYASYAEVPLPRTFPSNAPPLVQAEWRDFTRNTLSPLWLRDGLLDTPETRWRDWLEKRSEIRGQKSEDNSAILNSESWFLNTSPPMPQFAHHAGLFREHKAAIRRELLTRNFRTVLDYLLFHGRGILNTAIYCTLAVLLALVVNPLAAYALSRFKPSAGPQILLFLMLTMAFPHMVTQIPVFILLRELGLLNTFAALLLPGMASGYSIFLLKGFFDSLPRDLYESAQLDGAGEWTLFWHLTMRLSTPILSVIALQAFSVAYANFMYALLICQDPKMWTLMVWLYQLQQRSGPGVVQASLLIAALPTLAVFLACQRVLLRGIVVPVEK
ncbi:MAG TPA: ABC transporter permease subunit [Kiritimatiellia bacterium]|nr:ABC transporter permease subunit [Kiritimatiellia bacterium]HRX05500.1 ABC transporter permease subunit [Kiritimatiellia bacterium]